MKTLIVALALTPAVALADCAPSMMLDQVPAVAIDPAAPMVSHTETFDIAIAADAFNARLAAAPLGKLLPGTAKIPAVADTRALTATPFGQVGAPRVVCLADGNTAVEEAIDNQPGQHFRYKVWHYSIDVAKPIEYGIGEFALMPLDASHTRVTWTYSFKLRPDVFPGNLGGLGRWLFKFSFVDRDYTDMMKVSAVAMSQYFR